MAKLVEVLHDTLVSVVEVAHPQNAGAIVRSVGEISLVHVRSQSATERDGDGVCEVLERAVYHAGSDARDEKVAEDEKEFLPGPLHHRLQAVPTFRAMRREMKDLETSIND